MLDFPIDSSIPKLAISFLRLQEHLEFPLKGIDRHVIVGCFSIIILATIDCVTLCSCGDKELPC